MARQPTPVILGTPPPIKLAMTMQTPTKKVGEVHWCNGFANADDADALVAASTLVGLRIACLPGDCNLINWVISQENVYRDANNLEIPAKGINIGASLTENAGADCVEILMYATAQFRRVMYFGCLPDEVVNQDQFIPTANPTFSAAFKAYFLKLTGQQTNTNGVQTNTSQATWGYLPQDTTSGTAPVCQIQSFTYVANSNTITVVTTTPNLCLAGDVVRIGRVQGVTKQFPMNQLWQVASLNPAGPDGVTLVLNNFPPTILTTTSGLVGGYLQRKVRKFYPYSSYNPTLVTTRKRGYRTALPLGKRKIKRTIGY
jgi:hypothetical protein